MLLILVAHVFIQFVHFGLRYIEQLDAFLLNVTADRPWLTPEDVKLVSDKLDRLKVPAAATTHHPAPPLAPAAHPPPHALPSPTQSWLANKTKEQAAKAPHEEPAFLLSQIPGRVEIVANSGAHARAGGCWLSPPHNPSPLLLPLQ